MVSTNWQVYWEKPSLRRSISDIKYSPSGKHIAIASRLGALVIFEVRVDGLRYVFTHKLNRPARVNCISWSPNGELVLVGCVDFMVVEKIGCAYSLIGV